MHKPRDPRLINYNFSDYEILYYGFDTILISTDNNGDYWENQLNILNQYPVNSNIQYHDFDIGIHNLNIFSQYDNNSGRNESYITFHFQDDQFSQPAFQIGLNAIVQKIKYYGFFFRFCHVKNLDPKQTIRKLFSQINLFKNQNIEVRNIARGDVCCDIISDLSEYYKNLDTKNRKIETIGSNANTLETVYIGDRKDSYNYTRIYNKILETIKRGKMHLYADYIQYKNVTRIELQVGKKFGGGYIFADIDRLFEVISSYLGVIDHKELYRVIKKYDPDVILDPYIYLQDRKNRTLKLINNGLNLKPALKDINNGQELWRLRIHKKEFRKKRGNG